MLSSSSSSSYDVVASRALYNLTKRHDFVQDLKNHQPGDLKWSARSADFKGWLMCNGRTLSRTEFPLLFEAIGTTYGSTNAANFMLPDCRGKALGASGQGQGLTNRVIGDIVGTETRTLGTNELPTHSHGASSASAGTHSHSTNATGGSIGLVIANSFNTVTSTDYSANGELNVSNPPAGLVVNSDGTHSHSVTVADTGNGAAFSIMQPTIFAGNVFVYSGVQEYLADEIIVNGADDTSLDDKFFRTTIVG